MKIKKSITKLIDSDINYWLTRCGNDLNKAIDYGLEWIKHFVYNGTLTETQAKEYYLYYDKKRK